MQGVFTAVGDDDQSIYGWRGATIENLKRLPHRLPAAEGDSAGAELPQHRADPARGQCRDRRSNPKIFEKKLWSRPGRRRTGQADRLRQRRPRGRARSGTHPVACARRARPCSSRRLRHPVPRQPPGPRVRAEAARGADSVQGQRRAELLRPRRDQGPVRLAAPAGEPATTTPPSCVPPPRPSAASATRRWPALGELASKLEDQPVRGAVLAHPEHGAEGQGHRGPARIRPRP